MFVQAGVELLDVQQRLLVHKLQELLGLFGHLEEHVKSLFLVVGTEHCQHITHNPKHAVLFMHVLDEVGLKKSPT